MSRPEAKPGAALPASDGLQPWLGLVPYSEDDRGRFFGREQDTLDLLRLVRRDVLTVLFGRSGTGKSSLLKAGLFPKLREENFLPVWIRLDHSGKTSYGRQVRAAIDEAATAHGVDVEILNDALAGDTDHFWEYLHRTVLWDARNQPVTPVLAIDQFEEIFTIGHHQEAIEDFLAELGDLAENHIPANVRRIVETEGVKLPADYDERHYKVIIALREDFVSRLDGLRKDMPSVMHNRHALAPMTSEQALEVVLKPGGDLVDEEVAHRIVRFVAAANEAEPRVDQEDGGDENGAFRKLQVEPALLSLVCSELNLRRLRESRSRITLEQVRTSSHQILTDFYERSLKGLDDSDRKFIEDRLVTASGFRTSVPVEEAVAANLTKDEIALLINRYVLRQEDRLGIPHIELTHDVLTKVVTVSRQFRREREEIDARRRKQEQEELERAKEAKIRRARMARWIATGVAVVFAALATFAIKSGWEAAKARDIAEKERAVAENARKDAAARALALNAVDTAQNDPELGLLLSIESAISALSKDGSGEASREIELALRTTPRESLIRKRYRGHNSQVYSVDFDATGERLVTGAGFEDSTARVWDVASGEEIARLDHQAIPGSDGKKTTVSCVRFSPDGKRIVTATYRDGGHVYVWDAKPLHRKADGEPLMVSQPIGEFDKHESWVTSVAFSPDGSLVASGGYDGVVRVWNLETRQEVRPPLKGHTDRIRSIVFSRDGKFLLTASDDGTAKLWDLASASESALVTFDAFANLEKRENLHNADISPAGTWIATGGNDRMLRVWSVADRRQAAAEPHPDAVMGVAFIDETRLVSVCNDATIRFWELAPVLDDRTFVGESARVLRLIASQRGHEDWIRDVAVSPDRRSIATASRDRTARRWALPPGGELATLGGYGTGFFWSASFGGNGEGLRVYAGRSDARVDAFELNGEEFVRKWQSSRTGAFKHNEMEVAPGQGIAIRDVSCSPDGTKIVTASGDQTAIVWDARSGEPLFRWLGHEGPSGGTVYHARFSPDGKRVVTASNDGTAQVWTAGESGESRDPDLVLVPSRGHCRYELSDLLNAEKIVEKWRAQTDPVSAFFWQNLTAEQHAVLAAPPAGGNARVEKVVLEVLNEQVKTGTLIRQVTLSQFARRPVQWLAAHEGAVAREVLNRMVLDDAYPGLLNPRHSPVYAARFSRDGTRIVTADFEEKTATVWDAMNGSRIQVLTQSTTPERGHSDSVVGASFSPDGTHVVTACMDGYCRVWNASTGALEKSLPHKVAARSAEYSPDGSLILTGAADGTARLWKVPGYQPRCELRGHTETIADARFSDDGRYIITSSRDGTVRLSYTNLWELYTLATHRVTRKLTLKEREQYRVTRPRSEEERTYYQEHDSLPASEGTQ